MTQLPWSRDPRFDEALRDYDLERLYNDLQSRSIRLSDNGWLFLRGFLLGYSPTALAEELNYTTANTINNCASRDIYPKLAALLGEGKVSAKTIIVQLARYKRGFEEATAERRSVVGVTRQNWGDAPPIEFFCGRSDELNWVKLQILDKGARLVSILGMGGIGKTYLSIKLGQELTGQFEYILWRSLLNRPTVEEVLTDTVALLSGGLETILPESLDGKMARLMKYLKEIRCLLILDNVEEVLKKKRLAGDWISGYRGYDILLQQIGETAHKSCLLLNSREKPSRLSILEQKTSLVQSIDLGGLDTAAVRALLLRTSDIVGTDQDWERLAELLRGNPLSIRLAVSMIRDICAGQLADYLQGNRAMASSLRHLISEHFDRLSEEEMNVMFWLAIEREPISLAQLRSDMSVISDYDPLAALDSLRNRSLVESQGDRFGLQPVILEYVLERLIRDVTNEVRTGTIKRLHRNPLLKTQGREYLLKAQEENTIRPILEGLINIHKTSESVLTRLQRILDQNRTNELLRNGYLGGNILNIICSLPGGAEGLDFSRYTIREAYLQGKTVRNSQFIGCRFDNLSLSLSLGTIFSVAYSPEGEFLAFTDTKDLVHVWASDGSRMICLCRGHTNRVYTVAFSPDGQFLASGSEDGTSRIWNVQSGECLQILEGHTERVWTVAFHPDLKRVVTGSEDGTIRIWDRATGECQKIIRDESGNMRSISCIVPLSDDYLACSSRDECVRVWEISSGRCEWKVEENTGPVRSVHTNKEGNLIVSGARNTIRVWNVETRECIQTFTEPEGSVLCVQLSPDNSFVASAGSRGVIKVWSIATGECVYTLKKHEGIVWGIAFHPEGKIIASAGGDYAVKIWEVDSERCLKTLQGSTDFIWAGAFSPDEKIIVSGGNAGIMRVWDVATGTLLNTLHEHTEFVWSVAFNKDGSIVASCSDDGTIKFWNVETGVCLGTLDGHQHWVHSIAFSPDGKTLVSGSDDLTVRIWDVESRECRAVLQGHQRFVRTVAYCPDGKHVLSGGEDGTIRLWDVDSQQCKKVILEQGSRVWCFALRADGRAVASGLDEGVIQIVSVPDGVTERTLHSVCGAINFITYSPNGALLAVSGKDNNVYLLDADTGECVSSFQGHTSRIWFIAFSPNGGRLLSCSEDETIRVWNVASGESLQILRTPRQYEGMNISGARWQTDAQKEMFKALGAVE